MATSLHRVPAWALCLALLGLPCQAQHVTKAPSAKSALLRAEDEGGPKVVPVAKGQRVFTCGHSFHVFAYRLSGEMARAAKIEGHELAGLSGIGGSRVIQHWEVADEKNEAKKALRAGQIDVLTLSPIWLPDEGIEKFAKLGVEHNADIRILVQEFWLPNDAYEPKYPLDTRKKVDHDATDLAELRKSQTRYLRDLEDAVGGVNKGLGKRAVLVVPVGQSVLGLRDKIAAGKAPGLKTQWDLFRDPWGHAQAPIMVLSGYCHFAAIYRRTPVGLPVPKELTNFRRVVSDGSRKLGWRPTKEDLEKGERLTEREQKELNRLLQELAWEAVTKRASSGVVAEAKEK